MTDKQLPWLWLRIFNEKILIPLEEALALQRLIEEFDLTHQQAAEAVGRSRVANE